jgi:hypothetical protein
MGTPHKVGSVKHDALGDVARYDLVKMSFAQGE